MCATNLVQPVVDGKTTEPCTSRSSDAECFVAIVPDESSGENTEVDIVAVPAIGAEPERTWIPYILQRSREHLGRTKPLFTESLPTPLPQSRSRSRRSSRKSRKSIEEYLDTSRDVDEDGRDTSHGPWLTTDLRDRIPQARVLLYDHGALGQGDTLQALAERLLEALCKRRKNGILGSLTNSRPVFFICHSTGGLVAKKALILANENTKNESFVAIANDSYGMTFIATPHQGSAYLSSKEFRPSIREVMRLRSDIPESLELQLSFGNEELREMAEKFKKCSTDLRINTYYETNDSDLAFIPANDDVPRSYHVPIASVASAIMDLEHEFEYPLSSDHVGCATFVGDDEAQKSFIVELKDAVRFAAALSKMKHHEMNLEEEVMIEVNGFFEDSTSSVKLWTARPSLADFFKCGPFKLLEARLKQAKEFKAPGKRDILNLQKKEAVMTQRNPPIRSASETQQASVLDHESTQQARLEEMRSTQVNTLAAPTKYGLTAITRLSKQVQPDSDRRKTIAPADPGPQLPAMDRLKLTWVHIPYTHSGWVPRVLNRFSNKGGLGLDFLKEEHWASNHNCGRHAAPHAKYVKSSFVDPSKGTNTLSQQSTKGFATYLQYLHWDTYRRLVERRKLIKRRMKQGRVRPIHQDVKDSKSIEDKMIWNYLGAEPPFHCRRTLDQYGYPNLRSTTARDDDQMLWKRTRPKSNNKTGSAKQDHHDDDFPLYTRYHGLKEEEGNNDEKLQETLRMISQASEAHIQEGNVLMVDQLWLWALDEKTVITFFPKKEEFAFEGKLYQQGDLHNDIYNEVNSGLQSVPDAQTFAALIVQHAVTVLLDRTAHRHLQILRIYEESLSILIERMTRSYKSFRKEGFRIRPDKKQEIDMDIEKQSKEDFSSLLELRDIYDELHTIRKLLREQRETLVVMVQHYIGERTSEAQISARNLTNLLRETAEAKTLDSDAIKHLEETARSLDSFESNISDMIESSENTEKAYSSLLDIKQKQANVDESRLARGQINATATQGRSIMIFTIITIVFLPLSFFTSLFGMNIQEWTDPYQPPPLHQVAVFIGPISVAVILLTLTLAFSKSVRSSAVIIRKITGGVLHDLLHLLKMPIVAAHAPSYALYRSSYLPDLLEWVSNRYLRHPDQEYGNDHNIWDEYAIPPHKSPRDVAYQDERAPSSRRRSFFNKIREKSW